MAARYSKEKGVVLLLLLGFTSNKFLIPFLIAKKYLSLTQGRPMLQDAGMVLV